MATNFLRDFSFSKLRLPLAPAIQEHVGKVYQTLFQMLLLSTAAAYLQITNDGWLVETLSYFSFIGGLVCLIAFYMTDEIKSESMSKNLLYGFAVFKGLALGPLIGLAIAVNPSILVASVGSSALVFASLSASVLYSPVPSQIYVTGMILSTLSISFWLAILNLFMRSSMLWSMELYLGLFLFSMYVIYDTQILIKKAEEGSKLYLRHCLELYIDAVAIFVRILVILLKKDEEKSEKKRKNKR